MKMLEITLISNKYELIMCILCEICHEFTVYVVCSFIYCVFIVSMLLHPSMYLHDIYPHG